MRWIGLFAAAWLLEQAHVPGTLLNVIVFYVAMEVFLAYTEGETKS